MSAAKKIVTKNQLASAGQKLHILYLHALIIRTYTSLLHLHWKDNIFL